MADWRPGQPITPPINYFRVSEDGLYQWSLLPPGIQFDLGRVRRERHELMGELTVFCDLAGARTVGGALLTADFNLSSARARAERAKILRERAKSNDDIDWMQCLEEFCQRVFQAERTGTPVVALETVALPPADAVMDLEGLLLLRTHPVILFGDGGSLKSYLALYMLAQLSVGGAKGLYLDWELDAPAHRDRLGRLFPGALPKGVLYLHCVAPLTHELERIQAVIRAEHVRYIVIDSIGFACDGPPESAETALSYLRATRSLRVGSLHLAHVSKSESGDQKPFGSAFWHNGARMTWYITPSEEANPADDLVTVGCFQRKSNVTGRARNTGFRFQFTGEETRVSRVDIRDVPELAAKLSLSQRMAALVGRKGLLTAGMIAEELDAEETTIERLSRRSSRLQRVKGPDGIWRIGLAAVSVTDTR